MYIDQIALSIENLLERGDFPSNGMLPGEKKLASIIGCAPATLAKALSLLEDKGKVIRKKREGTYVAERYLRKRNHKTWGMLVPQITYFYPELINEVEKESQNYNVNLIVKSLNSSLYDETEVFDQFVHDGVSAIFWCPEVDNLEGVAKAVKFAENIEVPIIVLDDFGMENIPVNLHCVLSNNFSGGYQATTHLVQHGYKKIVMVPFNIDTRHSCLERARGYLKALEDNSLSPPLDYDIPHQIVDIRQRVKDMLDAGIDAFFVSDDDTALALMKTLYGMGKKIPDDAAIIGYDNTPIAKHLMPSLTSIAVNRKEMAKKAVELISVDASKTPRHIFISPMIVARDSCGAFCPLKVGKNIKIKKGLYSVP